MRERVKAYSQRVAMPNPDQKRGNYEDPNIDKDLVFEGAFNKGMEPNLVTSHAVNDPGMHLVALDIDMPAELLPSKTPGHFHLYIDHKMPWEKYVTLLRALAEAGIIEEGYANASIAKGCTALRLPRYDVEFERIKQQYGIEGDPASVGGEEKDFLDIF